MSRIAGRFRQLAEQGRKALIPYVVAGDPGLEHTVPMMHALVESGADVIDLGTLIFWSPPQMGTPRQLLI